MASEELLRLAADFEPATAERWHELVDKVLRGKSFDDVLVAETYEGLPVQPLYTGRQDAPAARAVRHGARARGVGARPGTSGNVMAIPIPAVTNQRILRDLERGVTSIELLPVGMATRADLERTLEGVMLDLAPVALRPGPDFIGWAGALLGLFERAGADPASTGAMIGADPLGVMATHLMTPWPIEAGLAYAADLAAHTAARWPGVRALRADGAPYHNAGASDAQELACVVATLVTYLRSLEAVGLDPARAASQINLTVVATGDQFLTIAKVRALRRMLARVFEAAGAADAAGRAPDRRHHLGRHDDQPRPLGEHAAHDRGLLRRRRRRGRLGDRAALRSHDRVCPTTWACAWPATPSWSCRRSPVSASWPIQPADPGTSRT